MPLGTEVGLGPGDFVLDGDWYDGGRRRPIRHCVRWGLSPPLQEGGGAPQFSVHFYCGQAAGWIKMPLDTEVNLGPGDVVLDRIAAPPKRDTVLIFGSCLLWPNGWMGEDATLYGSRPQHRPHCFRQGPSSP